MGVEPPRLRKVALRLMDVTELLLDPRGDSPQGRVVRRTAERVGNPRHGEVVAILCLVDERNLEVRGGGPRFDRLRGERLSTRARPVVGNDGRLAVAEVDACGERDELRDDGAYRENGEHRPYGTDPARRAHARRWA